MSRGLGDVYKRQDNEVYSVTEEQLRQWLDEELAFLSYVTEGLLNICIEYIRKENGIIRV